MLGDVTATLEDPRTAPAAGAGAVLAELRAKATEAARAQSWGSSTAELLEQALVMEDTVRTVQAARLSLLAEVDARGAALDAGARSTAAWLTAKARVPYGEAKRTARLASGLRDHAPRVAEGL